jgi:hypothetical protein
VVTGIALDASFSSIINPSQQDKYFGLISGWCSTLEYLIVACCL